RTGGRRGRERRARRECPALRSAEDRGYQEGAAGGGPPRSLISPVRRRGFGFAGETERRPAPRPSGRRGTPRDRPLIRPGAGRPSPLLLATLAVDAVTGERPDLEPFVRDGYAAVVAASVDTGRDVVDSPLHGGDVALGGGDLSEDRGLGGLAHRAIRHGALQIGELPVPPEQLLVKLLADGRELHAAQRGAFCAGGHGIRPSVFGGHAAARCAPPAPPSELARKPARDPRVGIVEIFPDS